MKKFVVLMLVLGMASMANAAIVELSVNGAPAPDEYTLPNVSATFELDVDVTGAGLIGGELIITLNNEQGSVDWSEIEINPDYCNTFVPDVYTGYTPWNFAWRETSGTTTTPQQITIDGGNMAPTATAGPSWLLANAWFHCDSPTDVIITLTAGTGGLAMTGDDIAEGTLLDQLIVHQPIPEPATIALLGLGGLLLRRRK